jgi:peptide-methionine (R)-S-oxide reductase
MSEEKYTRVFEKGTYNCSHCGAQLFPSGAKFSSGTAWPSFRKALSGAIKTRPDHSLGMTRTEILCAKCGQHLGHVFDDGKECGDTHEQAGQRFCVLSEALDLEKK